MHPAGPSAFTPIPFAAFQAEILPEATPQRAAITTAYRRDEVSAVQQTKVKVKFIESMHPNLKITTPADLALAEALMAQTS